MSTESTSTDSSTDSGVALRLEAAVLPVADVDRAKDFYTGLGWRLDADFSFDDGFRIIQFTPPGSPASIQFGSGTSAQPPGSVKDLYLIVDDLDAARDDLLSKGAKVSDIWHGRGLGTEGHLPGRDPDGNSYSTFASFEDPDGNRFLLQEITQRLPGR